MLEPRRRHYSSETVGNEDGKASLNELQLSLQIRNYIAQFGGFLEL